MTRRVAGFTQAEMARALRAAKQIGPGWCVELEGPIIRIVEAPARVTPVAASDTHPSVVKNTAADKEWSL